MPVSGSSATDYPLTVDELAAAINLQHDQDAAARLLEVSCTLVDEHCRAAPLAVRREALIRTAGYLQAQPAAAVREERVGELAAAYAPSHTGALRHSGAMSLLAPWKRRRGGLIG